MKNDAEEMSMRENSKVEGLIRALRKLLNVEFDWDANYLSDDYEPPVEGPPIPITSDMILRKLSHR